jgi:2,3-bisphosphoglycerate-dependent phosphoglycerate mutase
MRQFLLVRHAYPQRVEGAAGGADPGLTPEGHAQARALAAWLRDEPLVAVYASPARRAVETAQPLARDHGLDVVEDRGLLEYDWGQSDYVHFEDLRAENHPMLDFWSEILRVPIAESEEVRSFVQKAHDAVDRIAEQHHEGTVAIVCHGGVINAWAAHLLGARKFMVTRTDYAAFSRVVRHDTDLTGDRWVISSLNEAAHLRGLAVRAYL